MHFCFVGSVLMCLSSSGGVESVINENIDIEEHTLDPLKKGQVIMKIVSSILAMIATPILVISNIRRIYWTKKNFEKHPDVHRLLPNM